MKLSYDHNKGIQKKRKGENTIISIKILATPPWFELPPKTDKIREINVSHGKNKRMHVEINCKRYFPTYLVSMKFSTLNTLKGALIYLFRIIT